MTRGRRWVLMPLLVLLASLAGSAFVTWGVGATIADRDRGHFDTEVKGSVDRIRDRLDSYEATLLATRAFIGGSESVQASEFASFVADLNVQRRYPGIQGIGFARLIGEGQVSAVEAQRR